MFTIGKVRLKNQLILAPMAGITNLAFRKICHDLGAGLVCSEMISANAIAHGSKKTIELYLMTDRSENPVSFQLFGSDPKNIKIATEAITNTNCDIIDINMGCPVRKITSINSGAMLMRDQKNAQNVIKAVIDNTSKPVTVKIRSGWAKDKCLTYLKIGKIAEDLGCSAVTLHAKTAEQGYSGKADWSLIKKLKESLNIPVIGNGELWCPTEIKNMIDQTGCDGAMIGRAAMGDPDIFRRTEHYLKTGELLPEPDCKDKIDTILKYWDYTQKFGTASSGNIKLHVFQILKGFRGSKNLKAEIGQISDPKKLRKKLELLKSD